MNKCCGWRDLVEVLKFSLNRNIKGVNKGKYSMHILYYNYLMQCANLVTLLSVQLINYILISLWKITWGILYGISLLVYHFYDKSDEVL